MSATDAEPLIVLKLENSLDTEDSLHFSNIPFEDFDRICRFCSSYEDINPVFTLFYKEMPLHNIILSCTSVKIDTVDSLPQNICTTCIAEVISCYDFREKCLQSESVLTDICNRQNSKKNDEETDSNGAEESSDYESDKLIKSELLPQEHGDLNEANDIDETQVTDNSNSNTINNMQQKSKRQRLRAKRTSREVIFKCSCCETICNSRSELWKHHKIARHSETRTLPCSVCKKIISRRQLRVHMRVHTKEKPYICKICSKAFSLSANLKRHIMTHTGERPYICEICGKGFIQAVTLHDHQKMHMGNHYNGIEPRYSTDPINCEICGLAFKRPVRYIMHLQKHQSEGNNQKKYSIPKQIKPPGKYSCDVCKRSYKRNDYLKYHQLSHAEKSFLCNACGKGFVTKPQLQSHLKIHTGEKPHRCTVCKKSFAHDSTFRAHMLIHTGHKPYHCKTCNKTFRQFSHLQYHVRTHSGERPYSCNYCDKRFALKGNLTVHIRTHTGETPYLCPDCGRGFHDSSSMRKHYKSHIASGNLMNDELKLGKEEGLSLMSGLSSILVEK